MDDDENKNEWVCGLWWGGFEGSGCGGGCGRVMMDRHSDVCFVISDYPALWDEIADAVWR